MEGRYRQKSDEKIVESVQSGEVELFGILVERYEEKIKRYSKRFLSNHQDIEDVVQEIFLKAYENIQSFDSKRKFSSWFYRIAHNELVNALKKKKHFSFDLDTFLPYLSGDNHLDEGIDFQRMKEVLDQCLEKLEPKYREPIIFFYFENFSYQEISDILQIPVSTVGVGIKRAKEKIKKLINKNYGK